MNSQTYLDATATDCGSLVQLVPLTDAARDWIADYVVSEPWQWLGGTLCIEWRYADAILAGLQDAGLRVRVSQ